MLIRVLADYVNMVGLHRHAVLNLHHRHAVVRDNSDGSMLGMLRSEMLAKTKAFRYRREGAAEVL